MNKKGETAGRYLYLSLAAITNLHVNYSCFRRFITTKTSEQTLFNYYILCYPSRTGYALIA